MLTVKNAADRLDISSSTIRYYDDQGLLPFIERDKNGYRIFQESDLFWLELIRCMRTTKMPVETLRHVAELHMEGTQTLSERIQIFEEHRNDLKKKREEIDAAFDKLETKLNILKEEGTGYQTHVSKLYVLYPKLLLKE